MLHTRLVDGQMKIQRVICSFKVQKKKKHCSPSEWGKPNQQVGESDNVSTHVSRDEVPNGAEIHSARAAPGVLSSVSPLIL